MPPNNQPEPVAPQPTTGVEEPAQKASDFLKAVGEASGVSDAKDRDRIALGVRALAKRLLEESGALVSKDVGKIVKKYIEHIDKLLDAQINLVLHDKSFQELEGSWRGLHRMVFNTPTDDQLQIKVLNASKQELTDNLAAFPGDSFDQNPFFKKIYSHEFDQIGGHPFGCLVGDYYFKHSIADIETLEGMARISAAAHCPFLSASHADLLGLKSWQDLDKPPDIKTLFSVDEYIRWRSFRDKPASMYIGLTMPRVLARVPYGTGANNREVKEFAFEEAVEGHDDSKFVWSNAAYVLGTNVARSFWMYGWASQIVGRESGGLVQDLPFYTFPTQGGATEVKCPTEIAIPDSREHELSKCGLIPFCYIKHTSDALFFGAQSAYRPKEYEGKDAEYANSNAQLSARLPYMFACCRFAHFLKCLVRDKVGSFFDREKLEQFLNTWIGNYVNRNPKAGPELLAQRPLSDARVTVKANQNNPGYYDATFELKPHFKLEGVNITLSLVSELKQGK